MSMKAVVYQHFDFPSLGHLGEYLDTAGVSYECRIYSHIDSKAVADAEQFDFMILLGSPASVNDGFEWVANAHALVRKHLEADKPAYGICFGAQLIASALGGRVVKLDQMRLGFQPLGQAEPQIFSGNWLCFHEEHILPTADMEPLMVDLGTVYAYRQGKALGIQFHPEMDKPVIERIIAEIGTEGALAKNLAQTVAQFDHSSRARSLELFEKSLAPLINMAKSKP